MNGIELKWMSGTDPIMAELRAFRHQMLYKPFNIPSGRVQWDDTAMNARHLVALKSGSILGYVRLEQHGTEAQVRHLCVDPDQQGCGLGGELLDAVIAKAKEQGAELIFLNARFTAQGLYRSRGFKEVGSLFESEQTLLPHRRMELAL